MTNSECLIECKDRIMYSGNLYGAKWREEEEFLKGCCTALTYVEKGILSQKEKYILIDALEGFYKKPIEDLLNKNKVMKELLLKLKLIEEE